MLSLEFHYLLPDEETSLMGEKYKGPHLIVSGCHSHFTWNVMLVSGLIHPPHSDRITGIHRFVPVGDCGAWQVISSLFLASSKNFNSSVWLWVKTTQHAISISPSTARLAYPKAPNSALGHCWTESWRLAGHSQALSRGYSQVPLKSLPIAGRCIRPTTQEQWSVRHGEREEGGKFQHRFLSIIFFILFTR